MNTTKALASKAVIIGRFQIPELTEVHKNLIKSVIAQNDEVVIILGLSPLKNTLANPLEFKHRKAMIEEEFPNIKIHYVEDQYEDAVWSANLDKQIQKIFKLNTNVTLYGSRDNFVKKYVGKYPTKELEADCFISANEIRKKIITSHPPTKEFRAGLVAASGLRYPTSYQTVDVAVINTVKDEILMVMKPNETKWRFIGGFSDPQSTCLEHDARREVLEETGVEVDNIKYVASTLIDDWRYKNEVDKIKTALFTADYIFGCPVGKDDVKAAKWFPIDALTKEDLVKTHHILLDIFLKNRKLLKIKSQEDNRLV